MWHCVCFLRYLVWWDLFNLCSITMLLAVLVIALYEHSLHRAGASAQARVFNRTFRLAVLAGVYPLILLSIMLNGAGADDPAVSSFANALLIIGTICTTIATSCYYRRLYRRDVASRESLAQVLRSADPDDASFAKQMQHVFQAYDATAHTAHVRALVSLCTRSTVYVLQIRCGRRRRARRDRAAAHPQGRIRLRLTLGIQPARGQHAVHAGRQLGLRSEAIRPHR